MWKSKIQSWIPIAIFNPFLYGTDQYYCTIFKQFQKSNQCIVLWLLCDSFFISNLIDKWVHEHILFDNFVICERILKRFLS